LVISRSRLLFNRPREGSEPGEILRFKLLRLHQAFYLERESEHHFGSGTRKSHPRSIAAALTSR